MRRFFTQNSYHLADGHTKVNPLDKVVKPSLGIAMILIVVRFCFGDSGIFVGPISRPRNDSGKVDCGVLPISTEFCPVNGVPWAFGTHDNSLNEQL